MEKLEKLVRSRIVDGCDCLTCEILRDVLKEAEIAHRSTKLDEVEVLERKLQFYKDICKIKETMIELLLSQLEDEKKE